MITNQTSNGRITAGQTLTARSVCDQDCIFSAEILARKGNWATVRALGETKRVKIHHDEREQEFVFALGRYSMAPTFRAP